MSATEHSPRATQGQPGRNGPTAPSAILRWLGVFVLGFLALHSLAYGGGFLADPAEGAKEFGNDLPPSEAAEHLASLVGVILLNLGVTAILAAVLLWRGNGFGAWLSLGLGVAMFSVSGYWLALGSAWDVGIYGSFGILLTGLGLVGVRPSRRA